jgi:pantetheine-phosphate adenylyltransferase
MKRIAVYAGTFRPFHNGHLGVINRASRMFDELIIGVGINTEKYDPAIESILPIFASVKELGNVTVKRFSNLAVQFAKENGAQFLVRGLRAISDFDYEFQMSIMNKKLDPDIDTVFVMAPLSWMWLSSTIVRGVMKAGGDIKDLVPPPVYSYLMGDLGGVPE